MSPANPFVAPVVLEGHGVRLEPMEPAHETGLSLAAADGELWNLRFTSVPAPGETAAYVATALADRDRGVRLPFVVREAASGLVIGSTSYHDIVPAARRVEIGYTFYASRWQRSFVNSACKALLLGYAFGTLGCLTVGWRTDILNTRSQRAIERLGAQRDGIIRGFQVRRDGTVRDTVLYSMTAAEWETGGRNQLRALVERTRNRSVDG
jgi:RimJ/RimL family protein N-acetyltransferase